MRASASFISPYRAILATAKGHAKFAQLLLWLHLAEDARAPAPKPLNYMQGLQQFFSLTRRVVALQIYNEARDHHCFLIRMALALEK